VLQPWPQSCRRVMEDSQTVQRIARLVVERRTRY